MISYLSGQILNKVNNYIIVKVNNVGYKVFVNSVMFDNCNTGEEIELYTHQHVREDSLDLYGFKSLEDLEMFELLLSISGVGPKSALGVLASADINEIKKSITRGDSSLLTKVSGIGKKTAERVILELREKIGNLEFNNIDSKSFNSSTNGDEIDALMALGYSVFQAREALHAVDPEIKDSGERIKQALRSLG